MPKIPQTINPNFNQAASMLAQCHEIFYFGLYPAIDMTKPPKYADNITWMDYLTAITDFLVIGNRNDWIRIHLDGKGNPVYWLINPTAK